MYILSYLRIDLGVEMQLIKGNNRLNNGLLYYTVFPLGTQRLDPELQ